MVVCIVWVCGCVSVLMLINKVLVIVVNWLVFLVLIIIVGDVLSVSKVLVVKVCIILLVM